MPVISPEPHKHPQARGGHSPGQHEAFRDIAGNLNTHCKAPLLDSHYSLPFIKVSSFNFQEEQHIDKTPSRDPRFCRAGSSHARETVSA